MSGTTGNDTYSGTSGNNSYNGGGGNDTIFGNGGNDTLNGDGAIPGNDGTDGNDYVDGGDGNDSLIGEGGHDVLLGGSGNDNISGDEGNDTVDGGVGNDTISGGDNNDVLYGNDGNDSIDGDGGNDTLIGGAGSDTLNGGSGNDVIYGVGTYDSVTGTITLTGDGGVGDSLVGGSGNDTIYAGWNDSVNGGGGFGGSGNDVVILPTSGTWTDTGDNAAGLYDIWTDGNGHFVYLNNIDTVTTAGGVPCYLEGTRIMTARGEVAVEDLAIGDLVVTAHGKGAVLQPVVWVGKRRIDLARHPNRSVAEPILIRAGALGENVPFRDLRVSPEHAIFVDGRLVPAGLLVNGTSILREPWWQAVTWYHVELPAHGLLLAEGAPAESYFDAGNRQMFGEGALAALFPDFAAGRDERRYEEAACFPLLREEGAALSAIRAKLGDRAAAAFGAAPVPARPAGWAVRMPGSGRRRTAG